MATSATSELNVRIRGKDELSPTLAQLESKVIRWVGAVSAAIAAVKIGTAPIKAAADFERELANVAKTTNFTRSEISELSKALLDMSTRIDVSALDLAKIASAAGQQGLGRFGVAGVVQFTDSVSRMASVLDVTAEDAADNIGKIVNIFKVPLKDIETAISTFNQVSNNSTASGKDLLDVVRRIGDAAGALDLQQATALAATGLDFGQSPEVVGTAFAKIFSSLREKAKDFSKLLKVGTDDWIASIKGNGPEALKSVLQAFRGLKPQDQQTAIVKLFGGGRIGSLVNKLVQDTSNAVLDRNIEQALEGRKGNSAIKEQQTVLNTLTAQSQATLNSLFKLGNDVTQQTLGPLTQYVAQLNTALQSPGLKGFLTSVADSLLRMLNNAVGLVKAIAGLNINWENFVRVAEVFIGLKVASFLGGKLTEAANSFGKSLAFIKNGAEDSTKAVKGLSAANAASAGSTSAADAAFKGSVASRLIGYEELSKKMAAYRAAKIAEAAAEKEQASAAAAAQAAKNASTTALKTAAVTQPAVVAASAAVSNQSAALRTAQAAAAADVAAVEAAANTRRQEALAASNLKLIAIEEDYQTKKAAIIATGSRAGLTALTRERDQALVVEEASYARSLTGINAYYAKRTAAVVAGTAATVEAEKAALAARMLTLDSAVAAQAGKTANVAGAAAQVAAADAALTSTTAKLATASTAATVARTSMLAFGTVMRTVGTIVFAAGRLIASGFFWVTILYSIGDALGLFDNLQSKLSKVTDWFGFTSEAARKAAVDRANETKKIEEQTKALDDLIEKYKEFVNVRTGQVDTKQLDKITQVARTSEDQATKLQALAQLDEFARAVEANRQRAADAASKGNAQAISDALNQIADYNKKILALQAEMNTPTPQFDALGNSTGAAFADNTAKIEEFRQKIVDAQLAIQTFGTNSENARAQLVGLQDSTAEVGRRIAAMFTPETLRFAQESVVAYADIGIKVTEAQKTFDQLAQAARGGDKAVQAQAQQAQANLINLRVEQDAARAALLKFINTQLEMKGVPDNVRNSWEQLKLLISGSSEVAKNLVGVAVKAVAGGAPATGANANPNITTPADGGKNGGTFSPGGESKARKEARARLELNRATIQQENDLKEEQQKQLLEIETIGFDRGLVAFKQYYADRKAIQLQANQFDIDDKRREIAAVNAELKNATEKSEQLKFTTQLVKLQGQIKVLEEKRKAIDFQNNEEQRKAEESFADRIREETNKLVEQGIIPASAVDAFKGNLDEMTAQYRVFLAQLKTQGKGELANQLLQGFNIEALKRTLAPINEQLNLQFDAFSRFQTRLQLQQQEGVLTTNQYAAAQDAAIKNQIPQLEKTVALLQQQLTAYEALGQKGSLAYQQIQGEVDATKLRIEQLAAEQNKIAKDFNKQTTDALSSFLGTLEPTLKSAREGFLKFLLSIAQNIQKTLGTSISEAIMQSLGQTGKGGLGGWLQGLMTNKDSLAAKTGKAATARGETIATPLYVQDVSKGVAGLGKDAAGALDAAKTEKGFQDILKNSGKNGVPGEDFLKDKNLLGDDPSSALLDGPGSESFFSNFSSTLGTSFSGLTTGISGIFSGLVSTLGTLFSSLIAAMAGSSSGSAISGLAGAFAAAHTGGTAGSPTMFRHVSPAVFRNAAKYHNGGVAGLKPNEVPTVLEKGETIRTEQQERALQQQLAAASAAGGAAGGGNISIRSVLVADPNFITDGMASAQGERVTMAHLQKNKATIKQMLK